MEELVITKKEPRRLEGFGCLYVAISILFGGAAFLAVFLYTVVNHGVLFALLIGWLPAGILAVLVASVWPLAVILAIATAVLLNR